MRDVASSEDTKEAASQRPAPSPIQSYLQSLHAELSSIDEGEVATYIPELGKADPNWFAISIATVDGQIYSVGDDQQDFTIQSISKPFLYGYGMREYGHDAMMKKVGVEPTGDEFNSIILDTRNNRPFNPMVNAGAISVAELMKGDDPEDRRQNMLALFEKFAGRSLTINESVFRSEQATGHRNRAIAYMMLNSGMITRDPLDILDVYFQQCSVEITCRDLAVMAATLANDGVNPLSREPVLGPSHVRDVLTVMNSCGMYNYAGQWAYEVGMPAKSGVSGGIIAVIPGQIGIGVFSPPLDKHGNSIRGVKVCQRISEEFGLHLFNNRINTRSVIRREYRGSSVRSNRMRTPGESAVLKRDGQRIAVIELQGALYFGSVEQLIRRFEGLAQEADFVIFDFKRVHLVDAAAVKLINDMVAGPRGGACQVILTNLAVDGPLSDLRQQINRNAAPPLTRIFPDTDAALELCEDAILAKQPDSADRTRFAIAQLEIFKGLSRAECKLLEAIVQPLYFEKGEAIIREGDPAKLFFVVARGTVSVSLAVQGGRRKRIACIGPGLTFGEMALMDGGRRSADVVADERVICYGLSVDAIRALSVEHPNILITILGNLIRDFSERLRRANEEVRTLE